MKEKSKTLDLPSNLTMQNARAVLETLMRKDPRLRYYEYARKGMHQTEAQFVKELELFMQLADRFIAAVKWIQEWMVPRKRVNKNFTSYDLKHVVEDHVRGLSISNGTCIAAALYCGYRITSCSPSSSNVFFNMDSVAYAKAFNYLKTKKGSLYYEG
jgi:hypothetical protein